MAFHERVQTRLDELGLKPADLARATKKSPVAVGKWVHGESLPKAETLKTIAAYLGVSDDYLLTGKQSLPAHRKIESWDDSTPLDDDETEIPFFKDFSFACGSGSIGEALASESRKLRMSKATLRNKSIDKKNAIATTASGDSMHPTIRNGATIHIDLGRKTIKDGKIFAVSHGGLFMAKRLYNLPLGGVRIVSDNAAEFPEIQLSAQERIDQHFEIVGWIWQISSIEEW